MIPELNRISLLGALCLALLGCQTVGVANVESGYDPAKQKAGLAIMSLTISGYTPGTHWYQIINVDNPQRPVSLATNSDSFGLDWNPGTKNGKNFVGRIAVIELPDGRYEVRRWVMNVGNSARFASRRPISYRFSVSAGHTVYIGNVHTDIQQGASPTSLPYAVSITNEQERDIPLVLGKYPRLKRDMITIQVSQHEQLRDAIPNTLDSLRDLLQP